MTEDTTVDSQGRDSISGTSSKSESSTQREDALIERINDESFQTWYAERDFRRNIRQGTEFFNGPPRQQRPRRLTPSKLAQCKRKIHYRQRNAPSEEPSPEGIFWFGRRFEEDIALPYLADVVAGDDEYLANSLWVDYEIETKAGPIQIKGSTDPVIVDTDAAPVLPTEIKTKRSLQGLNGPNPHHVAQIHAYMEGLSRAYEQGVRESVILYGSRTHLDVKSFRVSFDPTFWSDTVLDWAGNHAVYRLNGSLPPATPEYDWECNVCDYRERCGKGSRMFEDIGPVGLLPLFVYPRDQLLDYLETHGGKITPTLAHHYPKLAGTHGAYDWWCRGCGSRYQWDNIDWNGDVSNPPKCKECANQGDLRFLSGPEPENQTEGTTP